MLPSFHIENFRAFECLTVKRLSRVNLIVGKNNVGKSAFLEALALYSSDFDIGVVADILDSRQEQLLRNAESKIINIDQLFRGYDARVFMGEESVGLKFAHGEEEGTSLKLYSTNDVIDNQALFEGEQGEQLRWENITYEAFEDYVSQGYDLFLEFVVTKGKGQRVLKFPRRLNLTARPSTKRFEFQHVPTRGLSDQEASQLWDKINLTESVSDVIESLQFVDTRVSALGFVDSVLERPKQRIPLVRLKDKEEPIPLKSLGDGITRVFHIMLAMMNAKDGILLVDEFENGLHWSVQEEVWEKLFVLAEKLNVQVFATTHSRDCVQAFSEVWNTQADQGAYFRLFQGEDQIRVQEYDAELLADSFTYDAETR